MPSKGPFDALDQAKRPREYDTPQASLGNVGALPLSKRRRIHAGASGLDPVEVVTQSEIPAPPVSADPEVLAYVRSMPSPPRCVKPQDVFRGPSPLPTLTWSFD